MGRGKFGIVHKCIHNTTQCEYAAKVSKCRLPTQRRITENEIEILNALNHPLIIRIVAAFEHQRQIVTVLELVSGGELFERLMENELISEMDVTFYIGESILLARVLTVGLFFIWVPIWSIFLKDDIFRNAFLL